MNNKTAPLRRVPPLHCYLAYFSALLISPFTWIYGQTIFNNQLWVGLSVTFVSTIVIWIFSILNNNSSIYDPYWVIVPPLLATAIFFQGDMSDLRKILIISLFWLWGFRYHIFYSWSGWRTGLKHEDWRYENMRSAPVPYWLNSLLGMHLFPTVLVYFAFAPAALILSGDSKSHSALGLWDALGLIMAISAISIEFFSDRQLGKFRKTDEYAQGGSIRSGLWKYSRHPNYFGEVLFWLSFIPFAVSTGLLKQHPVLSLTGPVIMAFFFRFSSWLTDKRSLERRPGYEIVMKEVSAMVPWFPKRG